MEVDLLTKPCAPSCSCQVIVIVCVNPAEQSFAAVSTVTVTPDGDVQLIAAETKGRVLAANEKSSSRSARAISEGVQEPALAVPVKLLKQL